MITIAHIADSHFDESSRWEECLRLHDWIAADLERRRPSLIVHAGDVYERKSTPRERLAVAAWLKRLAAVAPVVIVRGNHDAIGDLAIFRRLDTMHPVIVEEAAGVHEVLTADGPVRVACLAWPRKAELLARIGGPVGAEETSALAADALRDVLRGFSACFDADGAEPVARILVAHAMVRASVTSTGQPLVGVELEIGCEDLALADADYVALGHIHRGQSWLRVGGRGNVPFVYPGSPRRTAFGEVEAKGYVVAEIEDTRGCATLDGHAPQWAFVEAPATRMMLVEDEWGYDELGVGFGWIVGCHGLGSAEEIRGAEIRFRYRVDADRRDDARAAAEKVRAELLAGGAIVVKVEEVVRPVCRARAPEIAQAGTLEDKLRAFWTVRGQEINAERWARLQAKMAEVEGR